jgi:predicted flap endonuclease-1-like 5' DNA nuclease
VEQARSDAEQARSEAEQARSEAEQARSEAEQARSETEQARSETEQARKEADHARGEAEELHTRLAGLEAQKNAAAAASGSSAAALDLDAAREVLGTRLAADDLTVINGIGPKIAELFTAAGIDTWRALADADDERLREILADAGPRYRAHDPSPWSRQAALLADGRWQDFKDATSG